MSTFETDGAYRYYVTQTNKECKYNIKLNSKINSIEKKQMYNIIEKSLRINSQNTFYLIGELLYHLIEIEKKTQCRIYYIASTYYVIKIIDCDNIKLINNDCDKKYKYSIKYNVFNFSEKMICSVTCDISENVFIVNVFENDIVKIDICGITHIYTDKEEFMKDIDPIVKLYDNIFDYNHTKDINDEIVYELLKVLKWHNEKYGCILSPLLLQNDDKTDFEVIMNVFFGISNSSFYKFKFDE